MAEIHSHSVPVRSPLLPTEDVELVKTFDIKEVERRYREHLRIDLSQHFSGVAEVSLYRGRESGLEFFWPNTIAAESSFYEQLEHLPGYYQEAKWEFSTALALLNGFKRVLDIGCGDGDFVSALGNAGHDATGIDFNPSAVSRGALAGRPVVLGDLSTLKQIKGSGAKFDGICAFQLLEHLANPLDFLRDCVTLLRPGGLLLVAIPDGMGPLSPLDVALDLPPHHVARWNLAALQYLCRLLPIRMHAFRCEPFAEAHLPLLARACFRPLQEPPSWMERVRNRLAAAVASRYWKRWPNQVTIRGQSLIAVYEVVS